MYEDWVNGVSDGNTLHMWYSKDHLNLTVDVFNVNNDPTCVESNNRCWVSIPQEYLMIKSADKKTDNKDKGYPDEYWKLDYPTGNANDENYGRDLPGGDTFPEGFFHEDPKKNGNDTYNLHDGAPAFTFGFTKDRLFLNDNGEITEQYSNKVLFDRNNFDKKMRIRYNTLCDGTPDLYINYAKFAYTLNGKEGREDLSATIPFTGEDLSGKTVDPENVGKDYWNNQATCNDDYCYVHWRVWGNSKQSWWSTKYHYDDEGKVVFYEELSGISGVHELPETITMIDTLPRGWELAVDNDHPVYGRFVTMPEKDNVPKGVGATYGGWLPSTEEPVGSLPQIEKTFKFSTTEQNGYASFTTSGNTVTFTVPNDGSLFAWETTTVGEATEGSETGGGPTKHYPPTDERDGEDPIAKQGHSIIVYEFDTRISRDELKKQGFVDGSKVNYTNEATVQFGDKTFNTSGDTFVAEGELPSMNKFTEGNGEDNIIDYVVDIDLTKNNFDEDDSITLLDQLKTQNVSYIPDSMKLYWDDNQEVQPQPTVAITKNPKTNTYSATVNFKPAALKGPQDYYSYQSKKLKLKYQVRVKGVPGQVVNVVNSISIMGRNDGTVTNNKRVEITTSKTSAGASGSIDLEKVDEEDPTRKLSGAKFKVCKVDIKNPIKDEGAYDSSAKPWPCDGEVMEAVTDANGRIKFTHGSAKNKENTSILYNFEENTLYVAWEIQAPDTYVLNTNPQYFYLRNDKPSADTNARDALAKYLTDNHLSINDETFTVTDPHTVVEWGKVDESKVTASEGKYTPQNSAYIGGSEWELSYTKDGNQEKITVKDDIENDVLTDSAGHIRVKGLLTGVEYSLVETKAPQGFEVDKDANGKPVVYKFKIKEDGQVTWTTTLPSFHKVTDSRGNETGEVVISNKQPPVRLPSAGGQGILLNLVAIGVAFVVAGLLIAGAQRKRYE